MALFTYTSINMYLRVIENFNTFNLKVDFLLLLYMTHLHLLFLNCPFGSTFMKKVLSYIHDVY